MAAPLEGVRILDLSRLIPGPFATLVLADLGAVVDKLEDTAGGDYLRHVPPQTAGESAAFQLLNRGKRSAVLDLKHPEGRAALLRLVRSYDVLFEQFRPGVLDRLGLGHDALRAANPRLIVCALTGYGQAGPLCRRAGHDINYLARAGILGVSGPADGPPQVPGTQLADVSGGMWCAIAILAALAERARTGEGKVVDIAMTDGVLGFASTAFGALLAGEPVRRGDEGLSGGIAVYGTYETKDGRFMSLGALEPKFWTAFCTGAGLPVDMSAIVPGPHQPEVRERIAALFRTKTRDEWTKFAAERDCCLEPVLEPGELVDDEHLKSRGLFFSMPSPRGPVPQIRTPVTPSDTSGLGLPPRSGEHTRAVFRDAGFDEGEIDALIASGAARQG